MTWDGRSLIPAEAREVVPTAAETFVPFNVAFTAPPDVQLPPTPEGLTASVGEVTTEGFVLLVEPDPGTEPAAIEWIATTSTLQEG